MGSDLQEVHRSHLALIRAHFQGLRGQVNSFVDTRWRPSYLRDFIASGDLVGLATQSDPNEVLTGVSVWVTVAMEEIEAKRHALLAPIDSKEDSLVAAVEFSFLRLTRANAAITAHLQSLEKTQKFQDETLSAMGIKDLRDQVNSGLIRASNETQRALDELDRGLKAVDKASELKRKLEQRGKDGSRHD
jgi:hypothetical protein